MAPERRKTVALANEDRERLVRIETYCKGNHTLLKDHEDRIRPMEAQQNKHTMAIAGLWSVVTVVAGYFGFRM